MLGICLNLLTIIALAIFPTCDTKQCHTAVRCLSFTLRSCFTGDSSPEQVVHMLPKAEHTHTHTQFQKRCPYSNAYIHTDVVSNGIWKVDPPMYANHCHVNAPNAPTFTTTVSLATKQHFSSMKLMSKGTVVDLYGTKSILRSLLNIIQNQRSSAQYCYKQHAQGEALTFFHPNRFAVAMAWHEVGRPQFHNRFVSSS